jgi:pimeloyl-ACP methyl ester carboxylesterase
VLYLLLALLPLAALGADYGREKKWADEILPGVVVGDPVWLEAEGHRFLGLHTAAAGKPRGALILVHGIGVHPDWGLIGVLRTRLADAGYTTLSIQMPVLAADARADAYAPTFPEAAARIAAAARHLGNRSPLAVVAHSLGARMANEYFVRHPGAAAAYVAVGLSGPWPEAFPAALPVLDLYGSTDLPQVLEGARQRKAGAAARPGLRQSEVAAADHFFAGMETQLAEAIDRFLQSAAGMR